MAECLTWIGDTTRSSWAVNKASGQHLDALTANRRSSPLALAAVQFRSTRSNRSHENNMVRKLAR